MIWFRLGIIADDKEVRFDHGVIGNADYDKIYIMLKKAFIELKVKGRQLLTQIHKASSAVIQNEKQ
ncbi:MAG: hypothetical protein WBA74_13320 [Cyclobacteriaceae bacterium]